jgi:hypothetical protein
MTRVRLGLVAFLAFSSVVVFENSSHAQASIPLPCDVLQRMHRSAPWCSGSGGSGSEAQKKIDEINRANAARQQVVKEQMDHLREALTKSGAEDATGEELNSGPYPSDAPYISDTKDKYLPTEPVGPTTGESRCISLMSTYRPGSAQPLPSDCMTEAESMSVYMPIGHPRSQTPSAPEPVIDGSQIPSIIDFTLGPSPSQSPEPISPTLQQLTEQFAKQIKIDELPSFPSPSVSQVSGGSQLSEAQGNSGTGASESSPASTQGQDSPSESDSGSIGLIDQIFEAGKNAREEFKNFQIQVGDRLRGITRDADGAPVKIGSQGDRKKDSNQDDIDINRAQNPANLGKGINKYDSDLHDTTNKKIDKLLDQ